MLTLKASKNVILLLISFWTLSLSLNAQLAFNQQKSISKGLDYSGLGMAFFSNGDYILSGNIIDTITLSKDQKIIPNAFAGIYIAVFNSRDSLLWKREVKSSSSTHKLETNTPVKISADGNILIAGEFTGSLQFPNGTVKSAGTLSDVFWIRYAKNGDFRALGTYTDAQCYHATIHDDLKVAISGRTQNGGNNAFIALFDSSGTLNAKGNHVFTGTKNNRDAITSVCFGADGSLYFAGQANSDSIGYFSFPAYIDAPNDLNRYTLFLGKFNPNHGLAWLKGATPIPGSQPYSFDLNNVHFQNKLNRIVFTGLYNRANFYLGKDTFSQTSTVNSDARKPLILCLDTAGKTLWYSSLGLNSENQRGEIYSLSAFENDLIISADIEHYLFSNLKIGNLEFNWGDKALGIIRFDSLGNIKAAFGTDPSQKQKITWVKSCEFHPQKGYAMTLLNENPSDTLQFPKLSLLKGSHLITAFECNLSARIEPFEKKTCQNGIPFSISSLPKGGRFYGTGIDSLGYVEPSKLKVGKFPFKYTIKDGNGCEASASDTFIISALTPINFGFIAPEWCPKDTQIILNATPKGGTYFGNGVNAGIFNPSKANPGKNSVSYAFTNADKCTSKDSIEIFIKNISDCETQNKVWNQAPSKWTVTPNPCSDFLKIRIPEHITTASVRILNFQGKEIQQINDVRDHQLINLNSIPVGLIWIILDTEQTHVPFLIAHDTAGY